MDFNPAFHVLTGNMPFRWQRRLFDRYFSKGKLPAALDLPTGLGKTSVMAIWLIARALADDEVRRKIPRRLVYVVDRRAVVDQATAEAEKLRAALDGGASQLKVGLGIETRPLPISTLRGQFVDNSEWRADPASPAIIIGTVDMIGSRLLFEGYGVSLKMRPYHAGLLGADALIVLDEAHLVPPFEKLIAAIEMGQRTDYESDRQKALGPRAAAENAVIPPFRLLSLSATGRQREGEVFRLSDDDWNDAIIKGRLESRKSISLRSLNGEEKLETALADAAWTLADLNKAAIRCLVCCDRRETAQKVFDALSVRASPAKKGETKKAEVELFTGARRFFEREETALRLKDPLGFIAGETNKSGLPVFLVATSAAEVGVDLDADHMVCDLVAWERMVQRFGRVNRRGGDRRDAKIIVIHSGEPTPKNAEEPTAAEKRALLNYRSLAAIKSLREIGSGVYDASPASLLDLKQRATSEESLQAAIDAATTPAPLRPALNRALVDAWSMTSLKSHTGRPEVGPWLRGWVEEDPPQTSVIWRTYLPVRIGTDDWPGAKSAGVEVEAFFDAAPPHASEKLETETHAVVKWLFNRAAKLVQQLNAKAGAVNDAPPADSDQWAEAGDSGDGDAEDGESAAPAEVEGDDEKDIAKSEKVMNRPALKRDDIVAFALSPALELKKAYRLKDFEGDKKIKEALNRELAGALLVVDARIAGLSGGLLDSENDEIPRTADDGAEWLHADETAVGTEAPLVKFRITVRNEKEAENSAAAADDGPANGNWTEVLKFDRTLDADEMPAESLMVEKWRGAADGEDERSLLRPQPLAEHQSWTEQKAKSIAKAVGLKDDYAEALAVAARLHDEGKRAKRWQRAFNAHKADKTLDRPLAKTRGPIDYKLLDGYRHEFGSLPFAEKDEAFKKLSPDFQNLVLHLIAAHHGQARPVIETRSCEDILPSALQECAAGVALRFARLQKQWGPWGLAWWEALLRAADVQASRENDEVDCNKVGV
jgi:CRISPR-associated endonuclease/helicase Cas3